MSYSTKCLLYEMSFRRNGFRRNVMDPFSKPSLTLICFMIGRFGSDKVKRQFLAPSITGDMVSCLGVSEAGAGSDVASKCVIELLIEKTCLFAYEKTRMLISCVQLDKLCAADQHLWFCYIEQFLYFLNLKFQASSHSLWQSYQFCVRPGQKP